MVGVLVPSARRKRFSSSVHPLLEYGCGEFKLREGTTAYAERVGYQEGTCASQGYRLPAGSANLAWRSSEVSWSRWQKCEGSVLQEKPTFIWWVFWSQVPVENVFFIGAPTPGNGCGEFKLREGTVAVCVR